MVLKSIKYLLGRICRDPSVSSLLFLLAQPSCIDSDPIPFLLSPRIAAH
jgi:hypothetical protein